MSRPPRFFVPLLLGLAALGGSPAILGDEAENLRQLQAMPRERRVTLSENLARFDKLPPAEQAAIRKLDAEIARKDPTVQARYRSVLRRYHLWVNGLSEDEKAQLKAADSTETRFNLAKKLRLKEIEASPAGPKVFGIRTGDFGVNGPYEIANLLMIWNKLTPAKRVEIARNKSRGALIRDLNAQRKSLGIPVLSFPGAEEKKYESQLESNETFKKQLGPFARRVEARKKADHVAKGESPNHPYELRFTEFLYFEDHKPKPVKQENLERFSAACPNWLHEMLDPLSPDDARAYLTILYRLLYPEPGEMPADTKPAKTPASTKPATPRAGTASQGPI